MLIGIFDPLGAQTDRFRCEVCQNLILSPMNTGFLRPAVATVPTVYGIETPLLPHAFRNDAVLQQYLPFTVLKRYTFINHLCHISPLQQYLPFTVLKL